MTAAEFTRLVDLRQITDAPLDLAAKAHERAALAQRFGLIAIDSLTAQVALTVEGDEVQARGRLKAEVVQSCAISGDDLRVTIDEPIEIRFVPEQPAKPSEVELEERDLDEIEYTGSAFDLGEAIAQSLALAIDPYATSADADAAREAAGLNDPAPSGPFAALAALKKT